MAEEVLESLESESGPGIVGAIVGAFTAAFVAVGNFLTGDRALSAFGRQGIDELGTALKAFPESIQVDESGSLWNPTQGEIAAAAKDTSIFRSYDGPTPGEIAERNKPYVAEHDQGQDEDLDYGY